MPAYRFGLKTDYEMIGKESAMVIWSAAVRSCAILVLLITGIDIVTCDLLPSPACELSTPSGNSGPGSNSQDDDCLCCCSHVLFGFPSVTSVRLESGEYVDASPSTRMLAAYIHEIDQPPRA